MVFPPAPAARVKDNDESAKTTAAVSTRQVTKTKTTIHEMTPMTTGETSSGRRKRRRWWWPPPRSLLLLLCLAPLPSPSLEEGGLGEGEGPFRIRPNVTDFSCEFNPGENCLWTWEEDDFEASYSGGDRRWPGRSGYYPMSGSDVEDFAIRYECVVNHEKHSR